MGTFAARTKELERMVGHGNLVGKVEVDQPYAAPIHEGHWLNFMGRYGPKNLTVHSGQTHFLSEPLLQKGPGEYMERLARRALEPLGLEDAMIENMEDLSNEVASRAPVELGVLKSSAHPTVTDNGSVVYDRPPIVPRLSSGEASALRKGRHTSHFGPSGRMRHRKR